VSGRETVDVATLSNNIRIIAESIARHIYNLTEADMPQLFINGLVCSLSVIIQIMPDAAGSCKFVDPKFANVA